MVRKRASYPWRGVVFSSVLFILFLVSAPGVFAKDWPEKPVDLVNPFGAGGAADVQARKLAESLSRDLGQPITVRNVTGAGGAIAYNEVQKA